MRPSTSRSERRVSKHPRIRTRPRQPRHDQGELDQYAFKASANASPSHVLPLEGQPAPTTSSSVTPITEVNGLSVRFADGDNTTCVGPVVQATASGGPETAEAGVEKVLQLAQIEGAIGASRENIDNSGGGPLMKAHSDEDKAFRHASSTSTGVDATQSIAAEREKARYQINEMARQLSGLFNDNATDSYARGPYDPSIEADQEDAQMDFSTPIGDESESDAGFGVLSSTTFHPLLIYNPHLYGHGLNIKQDEPIIEDIGSVLGADSVMEDAMPESQNVDVPAIATRTFQPFSWVRPSTSSAFHAIFPGVPFARTPMTACIDESVPAFQHGTLDVPYGVETMIPEGARIQQVAPPHDAVWPFVSDGVYPSQGGLPKEPQFVYAKPHPTSGPSVVPTQTTSHSFFSFPSPPTSKVDPVPLSSPTGRPIEVHKAEVRDPEGEVCSEPAGTASVQQEVPPHRYVEPRRVYTNRLNRSIQQILYAQ